MKILQVIPTLGSGGAEHFVTELSSEFYRRGIVSDILTLSALNKDNFVAKPTDSRVRLFTLNKPLGFSVKALWNFCKFLKKHNYDVVLGHIGAIKYLTLATLLCPKVKFFATIHSDAAFEAGRSVEKWSRQFMFRFNLCTPVTISDESLKSFEQFYHRSAAMIYNGVSSYKKLEKPIELRKSKDEIVFFHAASCQPVKNQELLLKAFNKLSAEYSNVRLYWAGNNSMYKELFESLKSLFSDRFQYLGVVPNVRDYFAASDAMCLCSTLEGMPITIIEAFSTSCVPLCTPVGGCVNMIQPGKNGSLSDDLTVDSYYNMLKRFVEMNDNQRDEMRKQALKAFTKFDIVTCADKYLDLFKR